MGLKWPVLIYLRLARKREMESREDEAKRGDDRLHPIVPRLDSTRGISPSREIVANSSQILPVICGNIIISPLLGPKICRPLSALG